MTCAFCKTKLEETMLCNVAVDYCPKCLGLWFEQEELRWAKDEKDKNLKWLDIDLWKDKKKFKISPAQKLCPSCRLPLYEIRYGRSRIHPHTKRGQSVRGAKINKKSPRYGVGVKVDVCSVCRGIWLDRGEFQKIIKYLKEQADFEILNNYVKNLLEEAFEVFTGPETLREEIEDFLTILKLLKYKFAVQHPVITKLIAELPK